MRKALWPLDLPRHGRVVNDEHQRSRVSADRTSPLTQPSLAIEPAPRVPQVEMHSLPLLRRRRERAGVEGASTGLSTRDGVDVLPLRARFLLGALLLVDKVELWQRRTLRQFGLQVLNLGFELTDALVFECPLGKAVHGVLELSRFAVLPLVRGSVLGLEWHGFTPVFGFTDRSVYHGLQVYK